MLMCYNVISQLLAKVINVIKIIFICCLLFICRWGTRKLPKFFFIDFQLSNPDITDFLVDDDGNMDARSVMDQQDFPDMEKNSPEPDTCKPQEDITSAL